LGRVITPPNISLDTPLVITLHFVRRPTDIVRTNLMRTSVSNEPNSSHWPFSSLHRNPTVFFFCVADARYRNVTHRTLRNRRTRRRGCGTRLHLKRTGDCPRSVYGTPRSRDRWPAAATGHGARLASSTWTQPRRATADGYLKTRRLPSARRYVCWNETSTNSHRKRGPGAVFSAEQEGIGQGRNSKRSSELVDRGIEQSTNVAEMRTLIWMSGMTREDRICER
jgi:hypothetical protein